MFYRGQPANPNAVRASRAGLAWQRANPAKALQRKFDMVRQRSEGRTLADIGREHGVTPERVRQICAWVKFHNKRKAIHHGRN